MDGQIEDVRSTRMKNTEPEGDRGFVVQAMQDGHWIRILENGTQG